MMLVLTRKVDQGLLIAGNIYVRVLGIDGTRVKIGIDAPKDVQILRDELAYTKGINPTRSYPDAKVHDGT